MITINYNNSENIDFGSSFYNQIKRIFLKELEFEDLNHNFSVTISFIDSKEIKELNKTYRNKDKSTDVLSFPIFTSIDEIKEQNKNLPIELGDIFVNVKQAEKQAFEYGNTLEYELLYLITHSFLHLLNYDHMIDEDKKIMRKREKELVQLIDIHES